MESNCPFCNIASDRIIFEDETAISVYDGFPVNPGHVLIIPKRHVANYFELSIDEKTALWAMVDKCKQLLDEKFSPNGYNIGVNVNEDAGQSIPHVHIHLIPRYRGDVPNPRGGVRGVIPSKQNY